MGSCTRNTKLPTQRLPAWRRQAAVVVRLSSVSFLAKTISNTMGNNVKRSRVYLLNLMIWSAHHSISFLFHEPNEKRRGYPLSLLSLLILPSAAYRVTSIFNSTNQKVIHIIRLSFLPFFLSHIFFSKNSLLLLVIRLTHRSPTPLMERFLSFFDYSIYRLPGIITAGKERFREF